ncbi:hypothetical protein OIO90_004015 [Microbotryomycetes sp. JL221]|nr:hypothetical protein OIO90_004015 [Microbotryomycetes sp. JL221]
MFKQSNSSYSSLTSTMTSQTLPPYSVMNLTTNQSSVTQRSKGFKKFWKTLTGPTPGTVAQPGETALDVINRLNKRLGSAEVQALHYSKTSQKP